MPRLARAASSLAVLVLPACAGADLSAPSASSPGTPREATGAAVLALHEDACFDDTAADVTVTFARGRDVESESADGAYDHAACRHHYVVDVAGVADHGLAIGAGATGIELASKDWCEGFWSEHEARACVGKPCAWAELGAWSERAEWHAGDATSAGHCERVSTGSPPELAPGHGFSRVRVVSQGGWVYWYKPVFVRFAAH